MGVLRSNEIRVVRTLAEFDLRFVVVGGTAMHLRGLRERPRNDLDVLLELTLENADRRARGREALLAMTPSPLHMVHVLGSIRGIDASEAIGGCDMIDHEGDRLAVLSRKHLIVTKKAMWRPKDTEDLRSLGHCHIEPTMRAKAEVRHLMGWRCIDCGAAGIGITPVCCGERAVA
ncbi:MAG: hypothetical protein ABIQ30_10120 [Devosia sp.]